MSHYSDDPASVRVDFFKETGKWGYTEAVKWTAPWRKDEKNPDGWDMHGGFAKSLRDHLRKEDDENGFPQYRMRGMTAVCLDPYHENSHPIMMKVDDAIRYEERREETRKRIQAEREQNR